MLDLIINLRMDAVDLGVPPRTLLSRKKMQAWEDAWKEQAVRLSRLIGYSGVNFIEGSPQEDESEDAFWIWMRTHELVVI